MSSVHFTGYSLWAYWSFQENHGCHVKLQSFGMHCKMPSRFEHDPYCHAEEAIEIAETSRFEPFSTFLMMWVSSVSAHAVEADQSTLPTLLLNWRACRASSLSSFLFGNRGHQSGRPVSFLTLTYVYLCSLSLSHLHININTEIIYTCIYIYVYTVYIKINV